MSSHVERDPFCFDGAISSIVTDIEPRIDYLRGFMDMSRKTIKSVISDLYPSNKPQCLALARLIDHRCCWDSLEDFVNLHIRESQD